MIKKLSNKISLLVVSVSLILVLLVGFIGLTSSRNVLETTVENNFMNGAELIIADTDRFLFERQSDLNFLTSGTSAKLLLSGIPVSEKVDFLRDFEQSRMSYSSISIHDADGVRIGDTRGVSIGLDESDFPYVKHALQGERYVDPRPIESEELGIPVIHFSGPIVDAGGVVRGVVSLRVSLTRLRGVVEGVTELQGVPVEIELVDQDGLIIYSNQDPSLVLSRQTSNRLLFERLKGSDLRTLSQLDRASQSFYVATKQRGYLDFEGSDWTLMYRSNSSELFRESRNLQQAFVILVVLGLVFGLFMSFIVGRAITNPIISMIDVAKKIRNGDFSVRSDVRTGDEIGILSSAINQMAEGLEELYGKLDKKVRERTRQIERESKKLEITMRSIADASFVLDRHGKITFINERMEQLMRLEADELIGKKYDEAFHFQNEAGNDDYGFVQRSLKGLRSEIKPGTKMVLSRGRTIFIEGSVSPIKTNKGRSLGVVAVLRNVTERRLADKAKTEFISLASHQLRTPLTAIRWTSEILLSEKGKKLSEKHARSIEVIYRSTKNLIGLVNVLLNLSRLESGSMRVTAENVDLKNLLRDVEFVVKPLIQKKKLNYRVSVAEDISTIKTDESILREVITNLVTNATKYTRPKGHVRLTVSPVGQYLRFEIVDDGYGIPESEQSRVFKKFFRGSNVTGIDTVGTGLGLYLVYKLLSRIKGKITFTSKEGKGTTFRVGIPLKGIRSSQGSKSVTSTYATSNSSNH